MSCEPTIGWPEVFKTCRALLATETIAHHASSRCCEPQSRHLLYTASSSGCRHTSSTAQMLLGLKWSCAKRVKNSRLVVKRLLLLYLLAVSKAVRPRSSHSWMPSSACVSRLSLPASAAMWQILVSDCYHVRSPACQPDSIYCTACLLVWHSKYHLLYTAIILHLFHSYILLQIGCENKALANPKQHGRVEGSFCINSDTRQLSTNMSSFAYRGKYNEDLLTICALQ